MSWVQFLKNPYLVLKVQKWFGVAPKKKIEAENNECIANGASVIPSSSEDEDIVYTSGSDSEEHDYVITNKFWYFLFVLGTELGDEIFYAIFISFWFWNIDGAVGRRVVMVWSIVMSIGQGLKDIICWPRPASPPVFRLQSKWSLEYGMPSTHAMVGVSIPFSLFIYTVQRYEAGGISGKYSRTYVSFGFGVSSLLTTIPPNIMLTFICLKREVLRTTDHPERELCCPNNYPALIGLVSAAVWCLIVSISRLYLGMHSVLDVIVGVVLTVLLMIPLVPFVDAADHFWLKSHYSPLVLFILSVAIIAFYPRSKIWTPTRQDTTTVISVCVGVHLGAWTNYQLGSMMAPLTEPPYEIIWPDYEMFGLLVLRSAIGLCCIVATKALCKSASYATVCFILRLNPTEVKTSAHTSPSSTKNTVELCYKYITYVAIGFNMVHLLPSVFSLLGIDRPTFYTEM